MKILQICNKPPFPALEGGSMAMNMITQGLINEGHSVKVIAFVSDKNPIYINELPLDYMQSVNPEYVYINLKFNFYHAIKCYIKGESYHIKRFISKKMFKKIMDVLKKEEFDIVQLETLYLTPYINVIRKYSSAKVILRSHNIEHKIWKLLAESEENFIKKFYLNHLAKTLKKYELDSMKLYDGIVAITENDNKYYFDRIGDKIITTSIPFGIDLKESKSRKIVRNFFFIGALNWLPNSEGVIWFVNNVWREFAKRHNEVKFRIAGRAMNEEIKNLDFPGLELVGEVEDAKDFILNNGIMIVPLFAGSGIRVKIIEAMAIETAIISTAIGASGISYTEGKDILIANTPEEFIAKMEFLLENNYEINNLGKNAHKLIEEKYNSKKIIENLISFYTIVKAFNQN